MSSLHFVKSILGAALTTGVKQCVVIGSQPMRQTVGESAASELQIFAVDELADGTLSTALDQSEFDKLKSSVFVWLGGAGCRTIDAMVASLAFIASLPKGTVLVLDYVEERTALGTLTQTALDSLASRLQTVGGTVHYLIQPQAVNALLRGVGFQNVVDSIKETGSGRLVTAFV